MLEERKNSDVDFYQVEPSYTSYTDNLRALSGNLSIHLSKFDLASSFAAKLIKILSCSIHFIIITTSIAKGTLFHPPP